MKKSIFQKAASFLMACAVAASSTVTSAFADDGSDTYTITINGVTDSRNNDGNKDNGDYKPYQAYQLFSGEVEEEDGGYVLKDIDWGSGFDPEDDGYYPGQEEGGDNITAGTADDGIPDAVEAFLAELKADDSFKIDAGETQENAFKDVSTAIELAQVLQGNDDDSEFMIEFSKIAAKYLTVPFAGQTYEWSGENNSILKIGGLAGGYYLIKDHTENQDHYAYSLSILEVAGDVEVDLKNGVPKLDKTITGVTDGGEVSDDGKTATAGVGSKVSFKLTGTLPERYSDYKTYYYQFTDVLPKGLTLDTDTITLTVTDKDGNTGTVEVPAQSDQNVYYTTSPDTATGKTTLKVVINDLNKVTITQDPGNSSDVKIAYGVEIVLTYDTIVNADAVDAENGKLVNTADLTFSNDPSSSGTGTTTPDDETPDDQATVFLFELDMDKNDGDGTNNKKLGGVGFTITDGETTGEKTAVFYENGDGDYTFVAWADLANADYLDDGEFSIEKWATENEDLLEAIFGDDADDAAKLVTEVFTGSETDTLGQLKLKGLAPDDYTFTESTSKDGYEAVKPFVVTLVAEVEWQVTDESDTTHTVRGSLSDYNACAAGETVTDTNGESITVNEKIEGYEYTGNLSDGTTVDNVNGTKVSLPATTGNIAKLNVIDDPKNGLPSTGGAGAWFYYICGGLLVLAGVGVLFFSKKKSDKKS